MSGVLKKTTGLTGLKVVENPEHHLRILYGKILRTLQRIPVTAAYRKYTEEVIKSRLQVVIDSKSVQEIELKINCGQVEELLEQGENELRLARKNLGWKPWEGTAEEPPQNQWSWPPTK